VPLKTKQSRLWHDGKFSLIFIVFNTFYVTTNRASLQVSQHDPVRQRVKSQHIVFVNDQARLFPVEVRYAWPSELDLMAQLAGLRLRHRWGNWRREDFKAESEKHISVYERSPGY